MVLILISGIMSGLTVGFMSLDPLVSASLRCLQHCRVSLALPGGLYRLPANAVAGRAAAFTSALRMLSMWQNLSILEQEGSEKVCPLGAPRACSGGVFELPLPCAVAPMWVQDKRNARRVMPLVKHHNLLLVTLVLTNAAAAQTLPIFFDQIVSLRVHACMCVCVRRPSQRRVCRRCPPSWPSFFLLPRFCSSAR
jgi:hypothetical protein